MVIVGGGGGVPSSHIAVSRVLGFVVHVGFFEIVRLTRWLFFLVSPPITIVCLGLCLVC